MAPPRIPLSTRFWAKVQKTNSCWNWVGTKVPGGYGMIWVRESMQKEAAHRVAWQLTHSTIPGGLHVLHRCDNPACVRPSHLFLGANLDNVHDKKAKDRQINGVRHYRTKLNDANILAIRASYATGITQRTLAKQYNINFQGIWKIVHRKNWKHL